MKCTPRVMAGNDNLGEVIVLGAGPAGLSVATQLAQGGRAVTVRAPEPFSTWRASYGAFEELLPVEYSAAVLHRFAHPKWIDRCGQSFEIESTYVRLDTNRLQSTLLARAEREGVRFEAIDGDAKHAPEPNRLCIDATGRTEDLTGSARYQSAYGVWTKLPVEWLGQGEMIFMDLSGPTSDRPPSFLYATREGEAHFLQETVLVSSRKPAFSSLRQRLIARLEQRGFGLGAVLGEELCSIAMGGAPSPGRDSVVHFGARAGLTHPASGYQLARCLRLAGPLAQLICQKAALGAPRVAELARARLWTWERRLSWLLFNYGAKVLSELDHDAFGRFMETFLSAPARELTFFVDGELRLPETLKLMARTYRRSDPELRRRLAGLGPSAHRTLAPS